MICHESAVVPSLRVPPPCAVLMDCLSCVYTVTQRIYTSIHRGVTLALKEGIRQHTLPGEEEHTVRFAGEKKKK